VDLPGIWLTGHNDWLQMLVEWGWIGGVAWILIGPCSIIAGVLLLRRSPALSRREAPMIRGTMIGLAVTGLHGAFDFPFQIFSITVVAMLMAGFLWGKSSGQTPSHGGSRSTRGRRATSSSELLELWKSKDFKP
jgi:O-antigen ligase